MKILQALLGFVLLGGTALAAEVTFARAPAVENHDNKMVVCFSASASTDAEIAILNAKGEVIRSLVAGVLGKNAPEPFKKDSLAQAVAWDGLSDDGRPAEGGPFKMRVRLGLRPKLEGYLFDNPGRIENTVGCALGVDKQGNLYHQSCPGYGSTGGFRWSARGMLTRIYDRTGKYVRTIVPYPANTPKERLKDTGAFFVDGHLNPIWHNSHEFRLYPGRSMGEHELIVSNQGSTYTLTAWHANHIQYESQVRFRIIDKDGGIPAETGLATPEILFPKGVGIHARRTWVAKSADEKWIYLSGFLLDSTYDKFSHAVYRMKFDGSAAPTEFFGSTRESGKDEKHLNSPRGVAVNGHGLVYISDFENNRIVVADESNGSFVRSIPIQKPTTVQVQPETGELYVLCTSPKIIDLVKISGGPAPKELARVPVGRPVGDDPCMVIDASAKPTVVWVGGGNFFGKALMRFEDGPNGFAETAFPEAPPKDAFFAESCHDLMVDRKRNELYIKASWRNLARMDLSSGAVTKLPALGTDSDGASWALSPDGETIYSFGFFSGVRKWTRDLKPLKFEASSEDTLSASPTEEDKKRFDGNFQAHIFAPMTYQTRCLSVSPTGDIYVIPAGNNQKRRDIPMTFDRISEVQVYSPDGKRKGTAIWRCSLGAVGPRFDRRGNIYLAESVLPNVESIVPEFFKDRLPPLIVTSTPEHQPSNPRGCLAIIYGSIVKFPAAGGIIWYSNHLLPDKAGLGSDVPECVRNLPELPVRQFKGNAGTTVNIKIQGASWCYYGASPIMDKEGGSCNCLGARFDVDDFGRVFFPDVGRFRFGILDTNGNEIGFAGYYGNRDSGGPGSLLPQEEVAFAYPFTVAVSNTHILVGDLMNNRIAKLRMTYAAEAVCDLK